MFITGPVEGLIPDFHCPLESSMKSVLPQSGRFEFGFPKLDTQVLVEVSGEEVTIRATRDSFSDQRKASFIHELVEEGFIPDGYRWFSTREHGGFLGVRWLVDFSWLVLPVAALRATRRFMIGLLFGSSLLWLLLMTALFLRLLSSSSG